MNASGLTRIETLNKENYGTWKMRIEALLIKNDAWSYVNGDTVKPGLGEDYANLRAVETWIRNDNKAKSDIILSISPSELKHVKGCSTSREVWLKLERICQSKGPVRKATLLKQRFSQQRFDVSSLSQFNDCHDETHWTAPKRVLRYLKGTMSIGILSKHTRDPLKCFVDSDWASCLNDRRSYTRFTTILSSGPVSWEAKKQRTVALSSNEAEYTGLAKAAKECIYFRGYLKELGYRDLANVIILNDNLGAQKLAENSSFHARSEHIDVRHHFIREVLKDKKVIVEHVSTEDMTADIFTKGLRRLKHEKCIELSGMGSCIDINA